MTNAKPHEGSSCTEDISASKILSLEDEISVDEKRPDLKSSDQSPSKEIEGSVQGDDKSIFETGFDGFGFSSTLLKTLLEKGYKNPSPIQRAAIPELMLGRDLVGQAQTGTGKTAAFALPLIERLQEHQVSPQALVLAPTRELALQVADSFRAYAVGHKHLKILAVYGGADFRFQINSLRKGVDVVVGTPGRVMDHIRQKTFDTSNLKSLILDEADEMLRMGFIDDVEWILEQLPSERQMVLFSATMPTEIRRLSKRYLNAPAEITIKTKAQEARRIRHRCITIHNSRKLEALKRVLESFVGEGVIVFARTKVITLDVAESLEASGHEVAVLNGDVPQNQRERTVESLKNGRVNVLVATDVAARGLDVDRVGLVVNYDIPFDSEAYVHRIGRTGRAGRKGEAILFINPRERRFVSTLERAVGQPIEAMGIPSNSEINESRVNRLRERLTLTSKTLDSSNEETELLKEILSGLAKEENLNLEDIALAALKLGIGPDSLLFDGDERWIDEPLPRGRRVDRRQDRHGSGRRQDRNARPPEENMERFRVEVGHRDHVKPGNLVGAIANESGLHGRKIGRIQIFDTHSFVDLPKGMPEDVFKILKKLKVMNRELQIQRTS
ncbi:DEAD/DEAH box helicase [Prochlorococcus sp. MIT 1341]|uniref:DEAD/DEAH box helicase n=1 Tax=Prochlorococcus sp. MIT 1341 TaxID=3096221 RepID=UPI002A760948|nr:DEAD/DEAH box helicase [Prochlorococcus sp. MIT 1341]